MKDWVDLGGNQQQVVSKLEQGSGIQLPKHYATAENKNEVQKKVKLIFIFIQLSQMQGPGRTKVILKCFTMSTDACINMYCISF